MAPCRGYPRRLRPWSSTRRLPEETLGGAGNVALNIAGLGATCGIVAVVGSDEAGRAIASHLGRCPGMIAALIEAPGRQTSVKTRFVAHLHNTHLLRADREETAAVDADVEAAIVQAVTDRLGGIDAVVLSDYRKGVLTPRVLAEIIAAARRAGSRSSSIPREPTMPATAAPMR